uniref:(northern house mosquito) hypothetical protein n=1 Tax=Culex pipiens TaxID=7175 RepID=A0A8D8LE38_CULPI
MCVCVGEILVSNAIGGENMCVSVSLTLPSNLFNPLVLRRETAKFGRLVECFFFICLIFTLYIFSLPLASREPNALFFFCLYSEHFKQEKCFACFFHSFNFQSIVKSILLLFVEEEHWSFRVFFCFVCIIISVISTIQIDVK